MMISLSALFETSHQAMLAYNALVNQGIPKGDLSVVMPDERKKRGQDIHQLNESTQTARRIIRGMIPGAIIGAVVAILLYNGGFTSRGLDPVVRAGPMAVFFFGGILGAILGALAGTVFDIGFGNNPAQFDDGTDEIGQALLLVQVERNLAPSVHRTLRDHAALDVSEKVEREVTRGLRDTPQTREERGRGDRNQPVPPLP